ncbi:hypothetical protein AX14_011842 [Amanita brunnescens Koide BX004]|nr:hypothetical protein AX14_011842 [Amanita brunnescens Koide BX004]
MGARQLQLHLQYIKVQEMRRKSRLPKPREVLRDMPTRRRQSLRPQVLQLPHREDLANLYKEYHPSPASVKKNEEARKRNAPPKGWMKQQMYEIHRMGKDDEDDDGFTKVSKGTKRTSVRFPASTEAPAAHIDAVPEDEEDTPLPLASDPLHRLERDTYSSRTPGAAVGRSMGGDANRRLNPADSKDGKLIANVSPPTPQPLPLTSNLSPEL